MAHLTVADEQYIFRRETRNKFLIILGAGIALFLLGLFLAMNEEKEGAGHEEHGMVKTEKLVASTDHATVDQQQGEAGHQEHAEAAGHEGKGWVERLIANLWMNNIFFLGVALIGLFFVAIQYATKAGWSAGILRVPLAMGSWIWISGILMVVLYFVAGHRIFHWSHHDLFIKDGPDFDPILYGKAGYFYWPAEPGSFPVFFVFRMVLFLAVWYWFFVLIKKNMLAEDLDNSTVYWFKNVKVSAKFLVFFGLSSTVAAWDWMMSIDPHWFSTMFGFYVFASWWVTGLAAITLVVAYLKDAGYLKVVNANHLHDLGKFVFAFSIFWTYIWFGQFLLIYYANIPEETVYFIERMRTSPYSWIFYAVLFLNFVFPILLLMTRDSKRKLSTLKLICIIVIIGHWFDFYSLVTPGVVHSEGGIGFMEIGTALIFLAAYLLVSLTSLTKFPLIGKNNPMLQESLNHHI